MAIQPPPAAPVAPALTPTPPAKKGGCAGCGFSCLGCLGVFVVLAILLVGGGWYFLVVQAQAGVTAPASLLVITPKVDVGKNDSGYRPAIPGEQLPAGSSVRTAGDGHAAIQFPDGSFTRMSPDTTVTVNAAQLSKEGNLSSASLQQKIGRTFSSVQHLVGGATFKVGGHSVSAQVRGTEFEILVRANSTNLIKVFDGSVSVSGATSITLNAGQEVDADANGRLSAPRPIQPEPGDPHALASQCARTVAAGTTAGTRQTSTGEGLATGQSAEVDYNSPGGTLTIALCYPGSFMTLSIINPNGTVFSSRASSRPVVTHLSGPPGRYRAIVKAIDAPGGEAYAVSFATNAGCASGPIDSGGIVRQTLSNAEIARSLQESGVTGVTLAVQGTSPTSARVYYYSSIGGMTISWTVVFYAATPNLGAVITQVTVRGINITTQVVSRLTSAAGSSITAIPSDFTVDRVYSCKGPQGGMMVIEGHR